MSADAKVWQDDDGDWCGICDAQPGETFRVTAYDLLSLLRDVDEIMKPSGGSMRWMLCVYPDGKAGLRGFTW